MRQPRQREGASAGEDEILEVGILPRQYKIHIRGLGFAGYFAAALVTLGCLLAACGKSPAEASAVADQFTRAYFVDDSMAGAVKLASGNAKTQLEKLLRQIDAAGVREPLKDKPRVKVIIATDITDESHGNACGIGLEPVL